MYLYYSTLRHMKKNWKIIWNNILFLFCINIKCWILTKILVLFWWLKFYSDWVSGFGFNFSLELENVLKLFFVLLFWFKNIFGDFNSRLEKVFQFYWDQSSKMVSICLGYPDFQLGLKVEAPIRLDSIIKPYTDFIF